MANRRKRRRVLLESITHMLEALPRRGPRPSLGRAIGTIRRRLLESAFEPSGVASDPSISAAAEDDYTAGSPGDIGLTAAFKAIEAAINSSDLDKAGKAERIKLMRQLQKMLEEEADAAAEPVEESYGGRRGRMPVLESASRQATADFLLGRGPRMNEAQRQRVLRRITGR